MHARKGRESANMELFVAGLSYKTAPVEVREKLAVQASRLRCLGCRLKLSGGLSELVILSTCNRVELYGVTGETRVQARRLFETLSGTHVDFSSYVYSKEGREAVEHLFSVASGLDSMVIGETEITGQVKQAYLAAQESKITGRITNRLFQTALQVAKEIRTQTAIGRGSTSVGSVAVELAQRIFDQDLKNRTVLIIGAGKMGEACVRHLAKQGAQSVIVANRSYDKAVALAAEFGGRPLELDRLHEGLVAADIVVSSTGAPQTIIHGADIEAVMPERRNRPLFLIDIAVPRDIEVEVQQLRNVYLYNVDHLEEIVRENVRLREQELAHCQKIITDRAGALTERFTARAPAPALPSTVTPQWAFGSAAALEG